MNNDHFDREFSRLMMQAEVTLLDNGIYIDPELTPDVATFQIAGSIDPNDNADPIDVTIQQFTPVSIAIQYNGIDVMLLSYDAMTGTVLATASGMDSEGKRREYVLPFEFIIPKGD